MADSSYGLRDITLDINGTITARTVRNALKDEYAKVTGVSVHGTTGAGAGQITIRGESATGPIIWTTGPLTNATEYHLDREFDTPRLYKGLYVDAIGVQWAANSVCIIHTA